MYLFWVLGLMVVWWWDIIGVFNFRVVLGFWLSNIDLFCKDIEDVFGKDVKVVELFGLKYLSKIWFWGFRLILIFMLFFKGWFFEGVMWVWLRNNLFVFGW